MVTNEASCVIVKITAVYDYIYIVNDYDYNPSGNSYYNYWKLCNRL